MRRLVATDPNHPGWYRGPLGMARDVDQDGLALHLPVVGHQDTGQLPDSLSKWLARERETDAHLADRVDRYPDELHAVGMLDRRHPAPRLSREGGHVVLRLMRSEREEVV